MSGLEKTKKYLLKTSRESSKDLKEGVVLGKKSGKWMVIIKNTSPSKHSKPMIIHSQFKNKIDAENKFKELKK